MSASSRTTLTASGRSRTVSVAPAASVPEIAPSTTYRSGMSAPPTPTTSAPPSTTGRLIPAIGATGVSVIDGADGDTIGPPAA